MNHPPHSLAFSLQRDVKASVAVRVGDLRNAGLRHGLAVLAIVLVVHVIA